jgi:type IV pilus assembly protein PilC
VAAPSSRTRAGRTPAAKGPTLKTFVWKGRDARGRRIRGRITATTQSDVRSDLRRQGIAVDRIRAERVRGGGRRIRGRDIAAFTRQLATLLDAGVPLDTSLAIIAAGNANPKMSALVSTIETEIRQGTALSKALAAHPKYFEPLFINLVQAGEVSGQLSNLLGKIATYKEKTEYIKGKVKKAMIYPISVICVAILVIIILLVKVIPVFQKLFEGAGESLPAYTQMVINLSESIRTYGPIYLVVFALLATGIYALYKRSVAVQYAVDSALLKIPVIGAILRKSILARFNRTLATLFGSGINLVEGFTTLSGAVGNRLYRDAILRARDQIAAGQKLHLSLEQTDMFPVDVIQMLKIGEESGKLQDMANRVAVIYEEEVDNAVDSLSTLLEPIIIVVLGTIVGAIVIAMYLPIFQLGQAVGG